jgi:hypothetical protein
VPSDADKQITKKLRTAGDSLEIKVLDHLIVTEFSYFSFVDEEYFKKNIMKVTNIKCVLDHTLWDFDKNSEITFEIFKEIIPVLK